MTETTIFSFGYYGWGNHTPQLVEAVDAVEGSRGFEPPLFVDVRIRRTVSGEKFAGCWQDDPTSWWNGIAVASRSGKSVR